MRPDEIGRLRAPDPELDALPIFRLPLGDRLSGLCRQVIRDHPEEESAPPRRRGRPRKAGTWLEADLFVLLRVVGPYASNPQQRTELTDADRYRVIAETVSTVTGEPRSGESVKNRLAAYREYARRHPSSNGPPVNLCDSDTPRAREIRDGIAGARRFSEFCGLGSPAPYAIG